MSAPMVGILFACLIVTMLACAAWANAGLRMRIDRLRFIARPKASPMRAVVPGTVTVSGRVLDGDDVLPAPASGAPCVAYRVRIWGHDAEGNKSNALAEVEGGAPFVITDTASQVEVALPVRIVTRFNPATFTAYRRIAGARVIVDRGTTHRWEELSHEQKAALCELVGWESKTTIQRLDETSGRMPIEEWIVAPGDVVSVSGVFEAPSGVAAYRRSPSPGRVSSTAFKPLLVMRM